MRAAVLLVGILMLGGGILAFARGSPGAGIYLSPIGLFLLLGTAFERVLYKPASEDLPGPGWTDTGERTIDPGTGKTIAVYMTMGDFDFVAIGEGPDDRAAAAFGLALGATGTVRTSSLKAFGLEEAKQIVAALPRAAAVVA